jgi:hypothetical protein
VTALSGEWHEAQNLLWLNIEAILKYCGQLERRYGECYQTYASQVREMHALATKIVTLREDVEVANRRAEELNEDVMALDGDNEALRRELYHAHEKIRILERQAAGADLPPADTSGSKNEAIHEPDAVEPGSPNGTMELRVELTTMADECALDCVSGDEKLNQEADSAISIPCKRASPSSGDGGSRKAEGSNTNARHGGGRRARRGGKLRKLGGDHPSV